MGRVLAARFPDRERASQALESLHERLDSSVEAEIAPLATPNETRASDTLLAGHFAEEERPDVVEIVEQAGGQIVADVDERWTRPRHQQADPGPGARRGFTY